MKRSVEDMRPTLCLFCGGRAKVWRVWNSVGSGYRVLCNRGGCHAKGPWRKTAVGALNAWDRAWKRLRENLYAESWS